MVILLYGSVIHLVNLCKPTEGRFKMALMRAFSRVDKEGKIKLPKNIQREAGLVAGQLVELKIIGASRKKNILILQRTCAR